MERVLIIVGALLVAALLLYASLMQQPAPELDPEKFATVKPDDQWFQSEVIDTPGTVLVEFGAEWCGPCRVLATRLFPKLDAEFGDALNIVQVDIDEHPELAQTYEVGPIPTLLVFVQGKVVAAQEGFTDYQQLADFIRPHLKEAAAPPAEEPVAMQSVMP